MSGSENDFSDWDDDKVENFVPVGAHLPDEKPPELTPEGSAFLNIARGGERLSLEGVSVRQSGLDPAQVARDALAAAEKRQNESVPPPRPPSSGNPSPPGSSEPPGPPIPPRWGNPPPPENNEPPGPQDPEDDKAFNFFQSYKFSECLESLERTRHALNTTEDSDRKALLEGGVRILEKARSIYFEAARGFGVFATPDAQIQNFYYQHSAVIDGQNPRGVGEVFASIEEQKNEKKEGLLASLAGSEGAVKFAGITDFYWQNAWDQIINHTKSKNNFMSLVMPTIEGAWDLARTKEVLEEIKNHRKDSAPYYLPNPSGGITFTEVPGYTHIDTKLKFVEDLATAKTILGEGVMSYINFVDTLMPKRTPIPAQTINSTVGGIDQAIGNAIGYLTEKRELFAGLDAEAIEKEIKDLKEFGVKLKYEVQFYLYSEAVVSCGNAFETGEMIECMKLLLGGETKEKFNALYESRDGMVRIAALESLFNDSEYSRPDTLSPRRISEVINDLTARDVLQNTGWYGILREFAIRDVQNINSKSQLQIKEDLMKLFSKKDNRERYGRALLVKLTTIDPETEDSRFDKIGEVYKEKILADMVDAYSIGKAEENITNPNSKAFIMPIDPRGRLEIYKQAVEGLRVKELMEEATGIKSRVAGGLRIRLNPEEQGQTEGKIVIFERAVMDHYHKLVLSKFKIGGIEGKDVIKNPELIKRAIKENDELAFLRVDGKLQDIVLRVLLGVQFLYDKESKTYEYLTDKKGDYVLGVPNYNQNLSFNEDQRRAFFGLNVYEQHAVDIQDQIFSWYFFDSTDKIRKNIVQTLGHAYYKRKNNNNPPTDPKYKESPYQETYFGRKGITVIKRIIDLFSHTAWRHLGHEFIYGAISKGGAIAYSLMAELAETDVRDFGHAMGAWTLEDLHNNINNNMVRSGDNRVIKTDAGLVLTGADGSLYVRQLEVGNAKRSAIVGGVVDKEAGEVDGALRSPWGSIRVFRTIFDKMKKGQPGVNSLESEDHFIEQMGKLLKSALDLAKLSNKQWGQSHITQNTVIPKRFKSRYLGLFCKWAKENKEETGRKYRPSIAKEIFDNVFGIRSNKLHNRQNDSRGGLMLGAFLESESVEMEEYLKYEPSLKNILGYHN